MGLWECFVAQKSYAMDENICGDGRYPPFNENVRKNLRSDNSLLFICAAKKSRGYFFV